MLDLLNIEPAEHTVAEDVVRRWGVALLLAVGVREGFPVVRDADVPLDEHCQHDLDDERTWVTAVVATLPDQALPPILLELTAVRDLDLVRDDAWPAALATLAVDPTTRPALVEPAYVQLADGSRRTVPAYTVWWLREHAFVDGRPLGEFCAPHADSALRELLAPLDVELDPAVIRVLGLPSSLTDADPSLLLDRLADPSLQLGAQPLAAVYAALAAVDPQRVEPPSHIRVPDGTQSRLVDPDDVIVAAGPQWLQLGLPAVVPGSAALADVLGVESAADVYDVTPDGGVETPGPRCRAARASRGAAEIPRVRRSRGGRPAGGLVGRRRWPRARCDGRRSGPRAGLGRGPMGSALRRRRGAPRPVGCCPATCRADLRLSQRGGLNGLAEEAVVQPVSQVRSRQGTDPLEVRRTVVGAKRRPPLS